MDEDMSFERERKTREEYRAQNGYTAGQKVKRECKTDAFVRITFIQVVVCAVMIGALLMMKKAMPESFNQLKSSYNGIMAIDMSVKEVWARVKDVAGDFFEPVKVVEETTAPSNEIETHVDTTANGMGSAEKGSVNTDKVSFSPYYTTVSAVMPANGRISSPFGYREDPFTGELSLHTGLDIACEQGTPIAAAFYGVVAEVGENDVAGKYIKLSHSGGLETFYCHCSEILATKDAVIRQGETIALVGTTGMSTGPHLHFEVRIGGKRLNPEWLLYGLEV